ncbi:MAG: hypothetical protein JXR83_11070 [Deltaproteobacteria bacterium]|nr:hypothetical protein [Deltaproteobacteria bacterium]
MALTNRTLGSTALVAALALGGCAKEEIMHDLSERDANEILVVLDTKGISARKEMAEGRVVTWKVIVPGSRASEARRILVDAELPKPKSLRLSDVFKESGMIPTASEEKAKMLMGIQGEIEQKLKLIPGVLDVHAQVVIPDKEAIRDVNAPKPDPMASVVIVYEETRPNELPFRIEDIQKAVAASVEDLKAERVTVLPYKNRSISERLNKIAAKSGECPPAAGVPVGTVKVLGIQISDGKGNLTKFYALVGGAGALTVLLFVLFIFTSIGRIGVKRQLAKALAENLAFKKARPNTQLTNG